MTLRTCNLKVLSPCPSLIYSSFLLAFSCPAGTFNQPVEDYEWGLGLSRILLRTNSLAQNRSFTHNEERPSDQLSSRAAPERNRPTSPPAQESKQSPQTSADRSRSRRTRCPSSIAPTPIRRSN